MTNFQYRKISEIFGKPKNLKAIHAVNLEILSVGKIPYVTRTSKNNGIEGYVNNSFDDDFLNDGNAITFGAESGVFFYQKQKFVSGNKMYALYNENLNEYSATFIIALMTKAFKDQFDYGYGMIASRIENRKIPIPVTNNNEIDWLFMENEVREYEKKLIKFNKTNNNIDNSLNLYDREWKMFYLCNDPNTDICRIYSGADLPKIDRQKGNVPFIGSSSQNNGITDWISDDFDKSKYAKNVIGVNRNGSVGYAFFHPYKAYFSGDTRFIKLINIKITPAIGIFLSVVISKQKEQFCYGFKLGTSRLKNLKVNLPIKENGLPDWKFMEDYIKSLPNGDLI